jgi:hypothetical protein
MPLRGRGDKDYDDDARWEEQDMPCLSRNWRRAKGGEGDIDDGIDNDHVDGRVRGPRLAHTGNGRRRRLRRDGDNDDDVEEGGSHPTTPQTTATRELVERLLSASCDWYWAEEGEGDVDNSGNNEHVDGRVRGPHQADTVDG